MTELGLRFGGGALIGLMVGLCLGFELLWAFPAPGSRMLFGAPIVPSVLLGGFLAANWRKPFWRGVADFLVGAFLPVGLMFEFASPAVSTPVAIGTGVAAVVSGVIAVRFSEYFWS